MYKKGESGNPTGRPKGSINKNAKAIKDAISGILREELTPDNLRAQLARMSAKDRVDSLIKLAAYILPKPRDEEDKVHENSFREELLNRLSGKKVLIEDEDEDK